MDSNTEFLNYIYQNAEMGKDTISHLMRIVQEKRFKQKLESQKKEYNEIFDLASNKIENSEKISKGIGTVTKVSTYLMINLNTIRDKTPSHIAEMIIQGSTMGIVDIRKKLREYVNADKDVLSLANRLLKFEQQNIEEMKQFL